MHHQQAVFARVPALGALVDQPGTEAAGRELLDLLEHHDRLRMELALARAGQAAQARELAQLRDHTARRETLLAQVVLEGQA